MPKPTPQHNADGALRPRSKLLLTRAEAAEMLSMSLRTFERHVQPGLPLVRYGRSRLVPVKELERWVTSNTKSVRP